jgi:hypothetical protein
VPLDPLYVLWDVLMLQPPLFALFVAAAIVTQARHDLLALDTDGCVAFFSNHGDLTIDVERCVTVALQLSAVTPPSCAEDGPQAASAATTTTPAQRRAQTLSQLAAVSSGSWDEGPAWAETVLSSIPKVRRVGAGVAHVRLRAGCPPAGPTTLAVQLATHRRRGPAGRSNCVARHVARRDGVAV